MIQAMYKRESEKVLANMRKTQDLFCVVAVVTEMNDGMDRKEKKKKTRK